MSKQENLNPKALTYEQLLGFIEYHQKQGYSSRQIVDWIKLSCENHIATKEA